MDLLINYPGFSQDIKKSFKELIKEFNMEMIELHEGCYLLKGLKCNIRFTYDRGDVSCDFKQPFEDKDSPGYGVIPVYRFCYPNKDLFFQSETIFKPEMQLMNYANVIQVKLKKVLDGDFSWLEGYIVAEKKEREIINYVLNKFDENNQIVKKFWEGDVSWRQDFEEYAKDNDLFL